MRTPVMAANWKMNCDLNEAQELARGVVDRVGDCSEVEVVLCPPAIWLDRVQQIIAPSNVRLGAQSMFWRDSGAFTGEIAPTMLTSCNCQYVIVGHSERRGRFGAPDKEGLTADLIRVFGDTDAAVNAKARTALAHGLTPIICCGELLAEREQGLTDVIVRDQITAALEGLDADQITSALIAYEPVWAIGTGQVCDAEEANRVIGILRGVVVSCSDEGTAQATRILYGGSVKPDNIEELMAQPQIDGGLVGGASLNADSFAALVAAAAAKGRSAKG